MRKEIDKFVEQRLISVVPSKRQIAHQRREFYGFVHFTVNTFTGKEWGDGTEDEAIFNPVKMDADQWCDERADFDMQASRWFLLMAKPLHNAYGSSKFVS